MRTCPNCGHMLNEKDTICFKCGMQLSQINKQNSMMNVNNSQNGFKSQNQQPMQQNMGMNNNNRFVNTNNNFNKNNNQRKPVANNNKKDNSMMIYIIIGIVVLLAIIAVVVVIVIKNNKSEESSSSNDNEIVFKGDDPSKNTDPDPGDGDGDGSGEDGDSGDETSDPEDPEPTTPEPTTPSTGAHTGTLVVPEGYHEVTNNGYSYAIPDEYTAKDYETKGFDILNYQKTKEMMISISLGSVANLKNSLPAVKQMYIDSGAVVHNIKTTTISNVEVICVELTKNNQNMIIGITDAADGEIFVVAVYAAQTNEFDYDLLAEGIGFTTTAVKSTSATIQSTGA